MPDRQMRARSRHPLASLLLLLACVLAAVAAQAREAPLLNPDEQLQQRMMEIAHELRCLVCQNETLAASQADLAVDLRQQIREQLQAGRTAEQIRGYMVQRYGEFILYKPRFGARTLLLWLGPFALLALALLAMLMAIRRHGRSTREPTPELSAEQVRRARQLLEQAGDRTQ